ncbi:MAG TPA: hypothetical protein VFF73_15885 [Planctomycetota bacterium]|nr:hypothetical protein [Planctomycetota bacterium]
MRSAVLMSTPPRRRRAQDPFGYASGDAATKAIRLVQSMAEKEGIRIALIGGFAMRAWGSPRLTDDVDFAATETPLFASVGLSLPGGIGRRSWTPDGIAVDILAGMPIYADTVKKARRTRWGFRLASPEHLLVMKVEAGRGKDQVDVEWLLGQPGLVDRRKVRGLAKKFTSRATQSELEDVLRRNKPRRSR